MIEVELPDGSIAEFPAGTDQATIKRVLRKQRGQRPVSKAGAPAGVRALVGGAPTPEAALSTLQGFYPGAMRDPVEPENFQFPDPQTGQMTLYNPSGLDTGDLASIAREGAQGIGGVAGAVGGAPAGLLGAAGGAALGTAAGEELFNLGAQALGMDDPRSLSRRAYDTAIVGASGGLGEGAGARIQQGLTGGMKMMFRGGREGREEAAQAVEDLGKFGASPSLAQATRNPAFDALETFISRTPGGHGHIRKAAQETADKVAKGVEQRAKSLAGRPVEPEVAGRTVIKGVDDFVDRFQTQGGKLYDELDKFIPPDINVSVDNTKGALEEMTNLIPELPEWQDTMVSPGLRKIAGGDLTGGVSYEVLKRMRSTVGKKISSPRLMDDVSTADWKRLYGALSEDMKSAAASRGGLKAFERANSFWKAGHQRIDEILEPLVRKKVPEQVFEALETAGKKGATKLRTLRKSVTDDQWRVVSATVMQRMGKAVSGQQGAEGGEFSFRTFLTNWNKLEPTAKAALFDGPGTRGMRNDLDSIARAAGRIMESSQAFANPPGTAQGLIGQAMFLGGAASGMAGVATGDVGLMAFPAMLAMVAGGANLSARLMTNRSFVRWLASSTKVKPAQTGAHIGRLTGVAAVSDSDTKDAIHEYLSVLQAATTQQAGQTQQPPTRAQAPTGIPVGP